MAVLSTSVGRAKDVVRGMIVRGITASYCLYFIPRTIKWIQIRLMNKIEIMMRSGNKFTP
jgi:hypothetical protein